MRSGRYASLNFYLTLPQDADAVSMQKEESHGNRDRSTRTSWDPPTPPKDPDTVFFVPKECPCVIPMSKQQALRC